MGREGDFFFDLKRLCADLQKDNVAVHSQVAHHMLLNKPYNLLIKGVLKSFFLHNSTLDSSFPLRKMQTNHNAIIVT